MHRTSLWTSRALRCGFPAGPGSVVAVSRTAGTEDALGWRVSPERSEESYDCRRRERRDEEDERDRPGRLVPREPSAVVENHERGRGREHGRDPEDVQESRADVPP